MNSRCIYTAADAERMAEDAGQSYRPSNGFEGDLFQEAWCAHCAGDAAYREHQRSSGDPGSQPEGCPIIANTMAMDVSDPDYPTEWIIGLGGQPMCTAFRSDGLPERCAATPDLFARGSDV